jgi:hypothetical protein
MVVVTPKICAQRTSSQGTSDELGIGVKSENFLRGKNNMAKLNENLTKLRQHIESIKQQQLHPETQEQAGQGNTSNVNTGPTAVGAPPRVNGIMKKSATSEKKVVRSNSMTEQTSQQRSAKK